MIAASNRSGVLTAAVRNYWWTSSLGGLYFVGGFVLWGGTRAAVISSALFVVAAAAGLVAHYRIAWRSRRARVAMVLAHLLIGQAILIWQQANLPLSDYTTSGHPEVRDVLIYLVSALIVGTMSMFGGAWGAVLGLATHYAFIFNGNEEFSFKWAFPVLIAVAGNIVSNASWRLEQAYEQLELLANHDNLTGLFNRHRLVSEFEQLQRLARERARPLLLVTWDLDDLKRVNDTQGHAVGDSYIRDFARALQANVRRPADDRPGDAAFRVGGDEFISLHLDGPDADVLRDRVRQTFPAVSAGWVRADALTLDQALTQADAALYEDKVRRRAGRIEEREPAPVREV